MNPLSNFHKAVFTHENITYHSSEQFIQHCKATHFSDHITANKILNTTTTLESKQLSSSIKYFDKRKWEKVAKDQCKPGIKCKFQQNPQLANILINCTEAKTIAECTTDRVWGNRVPLGMDFCLDPERWISQGLLGKILEKIRSELKLPQEGRSSSTSPYPHEVNAMDIDPEPKPIHGQPLSSNFVGLPVETNHSASSSNQLQA